MGWLEFTNDKGARVLLPIDTIAAVIDDDDGVMILLRGSPDFYRATQSYEAICRALPPGE